MRRRSKKAIRSRRIMLLLFLVLGVLAVWGAAALVTRVVEYAQSASVRAAQDAQEHPVFDDAPEQDTLPLNTYDADSFYLKNGYLCYNSRTYSGLVGIDVSEHQQQIDWRKVAASGVDYAIVRIGYRGYTAGVVQLDTFFEQNYEQARSAGVLLGVYFFSQALDEQEAREEARFVLDTLEGRALELPVFFDWEEILDDARSDIMDRTTLTLVADAFCGEIEKGGYSAGIYFNQKFGYEELNLQSLLPYSFWLAEYNPTPSFLYDFRFWQYTPEGTVDGIDTAVDLNLAFVPK